jgi:hypothetical protein
MQLLPPIAKRSCPVGNAFATGDDDLVEQEIILTD